MEHRAPLVLIVDPYAEWYAARLAGSIPHARVAWAEGFDAAPASLGDARAVVTKGIPGTRLELTGGVVDRMPDLEWVHGLIAGHEQFGPALAGRPSVALTTTRGIHGPQMAETVLLLMLALGRDVRRLAANQAAHVWETWPQPLLEGRVAAIVGLGTSGRHLARVCSSLGMTVYGVSRTARDAEGVDRMFGRARLREAAALADFLVLVTSAEPGAPPLIDATVLAVMKPTAYVINVGRGALVDEGALVRAVRAGAIAGAGLDVFATEPLPPSSPLWELENVFVTPHIGGHSDRYEERALGILEANLRAFLNGRPADMVNVVAR